MKKSTCFLIIYIFINLCTFAQSTICGDVNTDNSVNIIDALVTAQHYVGLSPCVYESCNADVNGDNSENILDAYNLVLDTSGTSLSRDAVDTRVVSQVRNCTGRIIDSQDEVGGLPSLNSNTAPADGDQDGMPDSWETQYKVFNPGNAADRNGYDLDPQLYQPGSVFKQPSAIVRQLFLNPEQGYQVVSF